MTSEHELGSQITESSQHVDAGTSTNVGTNIMFVAQPTETVPCHGHVNQQVFVQGLPIVEAVTEEETDPSISLKALGSSSTLPEVSQFSGEGVDTNINAGSSTAAISMTHEALSGASHVNASENADPVGVGVGVPGGETLGVTTEYHPNGHPNGKKNYDTSTGTPSPDSFNMSNHPEKGPSAMEIPGPSSSTQTSANNKDTTSTSTSTTPFQPQNQQELDEILWMNNYNALREYQTKIGHTRVPLKSGPLGEWVRDQRIYYKQWNMKGRATPLTKERIRLLDEVEFFWGYSGHRGVGVGVNGQHEIPLPPQNHQEFDEIVWSNYLKDLRQYQTQYEHIRVPRRTGGPLGEWVRCQREYNRLNEEGLSTPLTVERKQLLDEMGFDWHPPQQIQNRRQKEANETWMNHYNELRAFQTQTRYVHQESGPWGEWARCQRHYNLLNEQGKSTPLTTDRKQLLDQIGFGWKQECRKGKQRRLKRKRKLKNAAKKQERLSGEAGGASGSQAIEIEGKQKGAGHANLEPIVSPPVQREAQEKYHDKIQLLRRFFK